MFSVRVCLSLLQMTELELTQFFSKFGEVKDAKIITDRDGGKSRGYGYRLIRESIGIGICHLYRISFQLAWNIKKAV